MHEYKTKLEDLKKFIDRGLESQNLPEVRTELEKLNAEIASEGFWNDADKAQEVSKKASGLQKKIDKWQGIAEEADELMGLLPEISPEKDADAADDFKQMVDELETKWSRLE
ncbi:PCRF domain-containing protein, partial [Candidatus Peregrinibacteria bacterium]|nr:PCRF domain-containing protein [Candidatus Peregrinibacteria bacterium]